MKLFDHQKTGIEFLKEKGKAILADEMGLGKTIQAIRATKSTRVVVVCPASVKGNWQREIERDTGEEIYIVNGRKDFNTNAKWIIINYDILNWHQHAIRDLEEYDLILDEAHYIKGKSLRAKSAITIAEKAERVFCLTGTPLMNRPIELWNLLVAIKHPLTERTRSYYTKQFCGAYLRTIPPTRWRKKPIIFWDESGASNLNILRYELKEFMLRRKKEEVLNLPDKIVEIREVELNRIQKQEYETAWDQYIDFLEANPPENFDNILMAKQLVEVQKLKQVCSRAKVDRIVDDAKIAIEQGEKIIIFTQYKKTLELLEEGLKKIKYDFGKTNDFGNPLLENIEVATLSGETKNRQQQVDAFQTNEKTRAFVANIKAGGVGINLTEASIVIFADMEWTPEIHSQAEDRAHRIGQNKMLNVYYYVAKDTIEEDIIKLLTEKKKIINELIDGTKDRVKTSSIMPEFLRAMTERS